jgi:hypothetical protein
LRLFVEKAMLKQNGGHLLKKGFKKYGGPLLKKGSSNKMAPMRLKSEPRRL